MPTGSAILSAPRLSLAIGAMAGILFAFLAWSIVWALAGQQESSYGLSQTTSFSVIGGDNATVPAAARSLTNILKSNDGAAVIDPQGNGAPGLSVIDPSGRIPWLPQESSVVGQAGTLWLFEGRYCADEDRTGLRCPLLPPDGTVAGKIPPPPQAGQSLQFAAVLTAETPLPAGRYIVTGLPSAARDSFQEALESTGPAGGVRALGPRLGGDPHQSHGHPRHGASWRRLGRGVGVLATRRCPAPRRHAGA